METEGIVGAVQTLGMLGQEAFLCKFCRFDEDCVREGVHVEVARGKWCSVGVYWN
jgi:hypothetical protein